MKKPAAIKLAAIASAIAAAIVVILVIFPGNEPSNSIASQEAEGYQVASVDITGDGFGTDHIELKAGIPAM